MKVCFQISEASYLHPMTIPDCHTPIGVKTSDARTYRQRWKS
jgi:hypothetical protein